MYIALFWVLKALYIEGGSPQQPPVCSIHLDDATAAILYQNARHTPVYWWRGDRVMKTISVWGWLGGHDGQRTIGKFGHDARVTTLFFFKGHPGIFKDHSESFNVCDPDWGWRVFHHAIVLAPCLMLGTGLTGGILQHLYIVYTPYMTCNDFPSNFRDMVANFSPFKYYKWFKKGQYICIQRLISSTKSIIKPNNKCFFNINET